MPSWLALLVTAGICCGPFAGILFVVMVMKAQDERDA